ncbi:MazG nucleotide pyrophosphohydrolase domain-containing protein [Saliphagus sp. LR7]|uniref:MazG nucleotide pyrophosphohydrolase domain-containing protein n=1 Tax=Saliphagus sp. LR7 TaxID=2282654 RepID=UPI000DF8159D|nr:MazG-like family protein [Saliphagus sp. LR7]
MDAQREVAAFVAQNGLESPPEYRLLDLASEVGELAKEVNESTDYGSGGDLEIASDEIGDAVFALLALAESVDIDAEEALEEAMEKYERRLEEGETPGSGA